MRQRPSDFARRVKGSPASLSPKPITSDGLNVNSLRRRNSTSGRVSSSAILEGTVKSPPRPARLTYTSSPAAVVRPTKNVSLERSVDTVTVHRGTARPKSRGERPNPAISFSERLSPLSAKTTESISRFTASSSASALIGDAMRHLPS